MPPSSQECALPRGVRPGGYPAASLRSAQGSAQSGQWLQWRRVRAAAAESCSLPSSGALCGERRAKASSLTSRAAAAPHFPSKWLGACGATCRHGVLEREHAHADGWPWQNLRLATSDVAFWPSRTDRVLLSGARLSLTGSRAAADGSGLPPASAALVIGPFWCHLGHADSDCRLTFLRLSRPRATGLAPTSILYRRLRGIR